MLMKDGYKLPYFVITNTVGTSYDEIGLYWNRFMSALRMHFRRLGLDIDYVWITELGQLRGMVHRHGYLTRFVPKALLKMLWEKATEGKSRYTHISLPKGQKVASYLVKYLVKDVTLDYFRELRQGGRRPHRFGFSRQYPRYWAKKQESTGEWKFHYRPDNSALVAKAIDGCAILPVLQDVRQVRPGDPPGLVREAAEKLYSEIGKRQANVY